MALGYMENAANPFLTPCFYRALFFTLAFILSLLLWRALPTPNSKSGT
jgi:hypothetical protein